MLCKPQLTALQSWSGRFRVWCVLENNRCVARTRHRKKKLKAETPKAKAKAKQRWGVIIMVNIILYFALFVFFLFDQVFGAQNSSFLRCMGTYPTRSIGTIQACSARLHSSSHFAMRGYPGPGSETMTTQSRPIFCNLCQCSSILSHRTHRWFQARSYSGPHFVLWDCLAAVPNRSIHYSLSDVSCWGWHRCDYLQ